MTSIDYIQRFDEIILAPHTYKVCMLDYPMVLSSIGSKVPLKFKWHVLNIENFKFSPSVDFQRVLF